MMVSIRRWICLVLTLVFICLSSGLADSSGDTSLRIACLVRANSKYWDRFTEAAEAEAARSGAVVVVLYTEGQEHVVARSDAVNIARFSGCSVIIAPYADDAAYLAALRQARNDGCMIIFVDNDGPAEYRDCYVGVDTLEAGKALAGIMLSHLQPGETALVCMAPQFSGNQNQALLKQGIEEGFVNSNCYLQYFDDTMNVDQTRQNELDTYLTEHTEVHGIFSLSQLQTRGYVQLASGSAWGSRVHIVGIDYQESIRPAIEDGVLSLLDKNSQGLGITAVQTALKLAAGEPIEGRRVYVETLVLDSSSLSDYLDGMR